MTKEEKDLNSFIDEAMEREADDYNRIETDADYMNSLMADAEELMPSEEFEEIEKPVHQLQDSIQQFQEAESLEGPQLETWQAFHPKHQEIIQNMQEMNSSYKQQAPQRVCNAVKQKAYQEVDKGLKHIAGVFDRGIHAPTERQNAILNLSSLAKQKEQPKQAVPEQKEKVKDEQQKRPDTATVSVQKLMDPASREKAVQALVESALTAGYDAKAVGKALSDLKLAVISSSLSDTPVENQQINKKLDMPLTVAVLMDRDSVSKAGLIQYFGSQGMTKEQAVSQCDDWKKAADSYMQHKGLVKEQEKDKQR